MRVLLTGAGLREHVWILLALGERLRSRGHRVELLANPEFAELALSFDIPFFEFGDPEQIPRLLNSADLMNDRRAPFLVMREFLWTGSPLHATALETRFELARPELVIATSASFGASWACVQAGIPYVLVVDSPVDVLDDDEAHGLPRNHFLIRRVAQIILLGISIRLNLIRRRLGYPFQRKPIHGVVNNAALIVGLWSQSYRRMPDRPQLDKLVECGFPREVMPYEPDQPIDEVHDFAQNGQPPVAIWTGSYMIDGIERFILQAVEACHDRGLRAMVFHRNPEDVADQLPENVGVFDLLAPADAFEHCSAVIAVPALDGFATVMAAGLPAIWIGANHSTRIAAMHAEEAGGCIHLKIEEANQETLSKGLDDIFSQDCVDEAISNALIIQAEDGLAVAADAIENILVDSVADRSAKRSGSHPRPL